jgi:hypothetical protein
LIYTWVAIGYVLTSAADTFAPIPGTRVELAVPENYEVSQDFAGIVWPDAAASIHVAELPVSSKEMLEGFSKANLAAQGMALLTSEQVDAAIGAAALLHVSQVAQGVQYRKWILIAGSRRETVLLTGTSPATLAEDLEEPIRDILLSARWHPGTVIDPREGVGFGVEETESLKIANSVMGSALLLTEGGVQSTKSPEDPFVVVARGTAETSISDLAVFSKRRLSETNKLSNPVVRNEGDLMIGGLPAHELIAYATAEGSVAVAVYQALAFDGHHYYLIQGRVGLDREAEYLEQFRAVARSLSPAP